MEIMGLVEFTNTIVNRFNRLNRGLDPDLTANRGLGFWRLNDNPA